MKKQIAIIAAAAAFFTMQTAFAEEVSPPQVSAHAYALYRANNGEVIAGKNQDERLPMASTTKIMTALIALEYADEYDTVTIEPQMYAEGSSMYLDAGETLKMNDLVGGMLMVSGNDAANAIALTVGGSYEGFARLMNERAASMGLTDTHFVTPSGLDADGHYTTARDLSKLMALCMENEQFAEIDKSRSITVNFVEPAGKSQIYYNENKLLAKYEYCIAGKTGFTDSAGRTLVSCAEKDGIRLTCVTLNDGDDWNDHISLYDYGFSVSELTKPQKDSTVLSVPIVGGDNEEVSAEIGEPPLLCEGEDTGVIIEYELPHFLYAPVEKGDKIGEAKYYTGGVYAGKADITADERVNAAGETTFIDNIVSFFRKLCGDLWRKEKWKKK